MAMLAVALAFVLNCGGGMTPEAKLNRMHFLKTRKKDLVEALKFSKEAYVDETGDARSRILIAGAATAFELYGATQQKSHLHEMFGLLNVVVNENLSGAPEAYHMVAKAYDKLGHLDKAIQYAKKSAQIEPDSKRAGMYYLEVVNFYLARQDHAKTIKEAEILIAKYPDCPEIERVKGLKAASEQILEGMLAVEE
ncbi:MAG: hypothetical protein A3I06_11000 [Candidatus Lindowbacteria bacterium RIFCSPLOWO2_02_FULL_62_12]|nr:MAG: hypothetical protein A3I06_11000 [Candidatus Lindowbacteria bacterium RIFCSPLOWO2_02_FULL_62_12]